MARVSGCGAASVDDVEALFFVFGEIWCGPRSSAPGDL
jgi:hypothetical protein